MNQWCTFVPLACPDLSACSSAIVFTTPSLVQQGLILAMEDALPRESSRAKPRLDYKALHKGALGDELEQSTVHKPVKSTLL